jgi:hypothetical protein
VGLKNPSSNLGLKNGLKLELKFLFFINLCKNYQVTLSAESSLIGLEKPKLKPGSKKRTRGENMVKCIQFNHLGSQLVKLTRSRIKIHHKIIIHFFFT